ncbi:MAG TPA: hypothetical protein PKW80_08250 [Bacteroidales bacterium]|nr:hypothetical protein [Bacteroidales bacterium]
MDCVRFKNSILNYYYGECDPVLTKELQDHLTGCEKCSIIFAQISGVLSSAETIKSEEPEPFYYTRLQAKIGDYKTGHIRSHLFARLAQPLAAACLAALGVFIGIRISGNLADQTLVGNDINQTEVAEVQLANEYFPKADKDDIIETYYLNINE